MPDNVAAQQNAVKIIGDILQELHIVQVIYIDDGFELVQSVEAATGWFSDALSQSPEEAANLLSEVDFSIPDQMWVIDFRNVWNNLDNNRRTAIIMGLSNILGQYIAQDLSFASTLNNLFPANIRITELGPTDWEKQREVLLAEASSDRRLLCLFDQDLRLASGFTETGSRSGIGLLKDLVTRYPDAPIVCGLLTHTLSPESEMAAWRRFAVENDLELGRFLPIAKVRLDEPLSFAGAIKKTTLNLYCQKMKGHAIRIMEEASRLAAEEFADIDVYDFEHIVSRSSFKEGVSEIDSLVRLYQIFHQDHVKRTFLNSESAESFNNTVEQVRKISGIADNLRTDRPDQRWELRHQELYEDEDIINPFHSPLQAGDLFRLTGQEETIFLLLAQPCDLMVRHDGRRGNHGDDKVAALVPIERVQSKSFGKLKHYQLTGKGILRYLYKGTDDIGLAAFGRSHMVRLDVLDLVVLNSDGACRIKIDDHIAPPPPQFHQAWRARYPVLYSIFQSYANSITSIAQVIEVVEDNHIRQKLLDAIAPKISLSNVGVTSPIYQNGTFDFGLKRIGRLRPIWANHQLNAYTRFLSREAEEHDFS